MEFKSKLDKYADHDCQLCELHETTDRVCVMGKGRPKSRLMMIGEAPGANEEETGKVFSGAAGKVLDQALQEAGLSDRDPYITNAVKCRPPNNATPDRLQWEACRVYLKREIRRCEPDAILLLGNVALRAVWGRSGITKNRGVPLVISRAAETLFSPHDPLLMATVHPAYVLRNPGQMATFMEDVKRFARMASGELKAQEVKTVYVTTESALKRVCRYLATQPVLSYDVENRYAPWQTGWAIVCLGISADGERTFVIPLRHPDSPFRKKWKALLRHYVKPVLERGDVRLIAQNGKHDNVQLAGAGVFLNHTFDIMLAAHLLDENRPKNLGFLSQTLLGADVYKGMVDTKPDKIMLEPIKLLARYNGVDTGYTRQLYPKLKQELVEKPRLARLMVKLMMPASHMIQQVEWTGMYVDQERLYDRLGQLTGMIEEHKEVMAEWGAEDINPNSPMQLGKWLFTKKKRGGLGLSPLEITKSGNPSTREAVLLHYKDNPAVAALLRYRTLQLKWMNTYLLPWSTRLDARSRLHTVYKLYGTVTGRLSGDLQQVPRDPFIRTIFGAPEGWCFIQADYSQIELRIAAHIARERRMIRAFSVGEDLHMATAVSLTGKSVDQVDKEERKKAKAVNFGFLYGMYPKKFQAYAFENYDLKVTMSEAEEARARYFRLFPDLPAWHRRQEQIVLNRGWVQSPLGRVRHLPDVYSPDRGVQMEAVRQAINSPVQGTASDLMLFGMVQLHARLNPSECFMVGTLHDGIFFECKEDKVDEWAPIIKETLENLPIRKTFGCDMSIPIVSDVEWGRHWGEPTQTL